MILFKNVTRDVYSEKELYVLGTNAVLKAYGKNSYDAVNEAEKVLYDIDKNMSIFRSESEVSKVNKNSGISPQRVSSETFYVIKEAVRYSRITEGAFDPTIGPLVKLWGIGTSHECIPLRSDIDKALHLVNYNDIVLNETEKTVFLKRKGQSIDLGAIAKGYAADMVCKIFRKNKVSSALIDLGGNIYALGKKSDRSLWTIGIQNPFSKRGTFAGTIKVKNKSLVTSGNYERYFVQSGVRYQHIIDPRTGFPSTSSIVSATIVSDTSIEGDGLSTGIYILGLDKSIRIINSLKNVDAVLIDKNAKVYVSSGLKNNFALRKN